MAYSIGLEDIKEPVKLTKCVVAEFLGTMFLVIIGCGTASVGNPAVADYTTKARNCQALVQSKSGPLSQ